MPDATKPTTQTATAPARPPRTAREVRALAVAAGRDPRTVIATYAGLGSDRAAADVACAAAELGYAQPPVRS